MSPQAIRTYFPLFAVVMLLALFVTPVHAAQKLWSGGGGTGDWNNDANWIGGAKPVAGDGVSFFGNPVIKTTNANLGNVLLTNIDFTGGDGFIINTGSVLIDSSALLISINNGNGDNIINAAILVNSNSPMYIKAATAGKKLTLDGVISGSVGLRIYGPGIIEFTQNSPNTYTGVTTVSSKDLNGEAGVLQLNSSTLVAIPGALQIGGTNVGQAAQSAICRLIVNQCIADSVNVTINSDGLFDVNGRSETLSGLTLIGGTVAVGSGLLTMNTISTNAGTVSGTTGKITLNTGGGITVPAASSSGSLITCPLQIGTVAQIGANCTFTVNPGVAQPELTINTTVSQGPTGASITKSGTGQLDWLSNNGNTYTGLTTIDKGLVRLNAGAGNIIPGNLTIGNANDPAGTAVVKDLQNSDIGLTSAVTVNASGILDISSFSESISSLAGTGEVVIGALTLGTNNPVASFGGKLSGTGSIIKIGSGIQTLTGSSTFTGSTTILNGTLALDNNGANAAITGTTIQIGDDIGAANSAILKLEQSTEIIDTAAITIMNDGQLDMTNGTESVGSIAGSGSIVVGTNRVLRVFSDSTTTYSGVISGAGAFIKNGAGTVTMASNNTLTGSMTVNNGALIINGSQPDSGATVSTTGTLGGSGTVKFINVLNTAILSPGTAGPGLLTGTGELTFAAAATFNVDLNTATPGGFDSLNITGGVTLAGSTLNITAPGAFTAPVGTKILLITNDAADAVIGTFANLPEGALITTGTVKLSISYIGGTGNDVELTVANFAPVVTIAASALPSPAGVGQSVAFTVTGTDANSDVITTTWSFGDTTTGTGASTTHAYAAPGTYNVTATLKDPNGGTVTSSTSVIVSAPAVTSAALATPSPAGVGQLVAFAVGVTDVNSAAIFTYAWDFGDASVGSGANPTHAYTAPGNYNIIVKISNGIGGTASSSTTLVVVAPIVGSGKDSDSDGFSDDFETAAGSSSTSGTDTPTGKAATAPEPLIATKLSIKLNFAKTNSDSISFGGTLPIPAGFTIAGKKATVDIGGVAQSFTLDAKGSSKVGKSSFKLTVKSKKGVVSAQTAKYSLKLNSGAFAKALSDEGLVGTADVKGSTHTVLLTLVINNTIYQSIKTVTYKAKKGKSGSATSK